MASGIVLAGFPVIVTETVQMTKIKVNKNDEPSFDLNYHSLRSVLGPKDQEAGRKRYTGIASADSLFDLTCDENVRGYLGRDDDGDKRKSTLVNSAILDTIENRRDDFGMLNSGIVIIARGAIVDDSSKRAKLVRPSIINGAQTMGVLKDYFEQNPLDDDYPWVNFELVTLDEEGLIADISIARNYQNRVTDLSIYGRQGRFDELEKVMKKAFPGQKLRKTETDFSDEYLDTEKLIQVMTAMAPRSLALPSAERNKNTPETLYRVYAYRHRSRCLKDFAMVMDEPEKWNDAYRFFLDIAPDAWKLYWDFKGEQAFSSLQCVKAANPGVGPKTVARDGVPDGIVFPMLSALSRFVTKTSSDNWRLSIPKGFPWQTLYNQAKNHETTTAAHNPQTMGKSAACYIALHGAIEMYSAGSQGKTG